MTITHDTDLADILVVEDSPTQAQHLARLLAAEPGCRVRLAHDGAAALDAIRAAPPDLVISDIAMPGMDGYALCRALKGDPALAAIPVLLLTRLSTLQDIVRALEAGADAFVRKPYDPAALLRRARSLTHRGQREGAEPSEFVETERRQIYELLVATHDQALRMNADLQRLCESLERIGELAAGLNQALSEHAVAQAVLHHLPRLVPLAGAMFSAAGADGVLRPLGGFGDAAGAPCARCAVGAPATASAFGADPGCTCEGRLCLPLMAGDRIHGMLHLLPAKPQLDDEKRSMLAGVAEQAAMALERARLYARMEAQVAERTVALRSERNRLSAVVDTAGALVLLAAPDGRIVMFNRACEQALGWNAPEVLGRTCWDVLRHTGDEQLVRSLFERLPQTEPPRRVEGEWHTRDGRTRTIAWTLTVLRAVDGSVEYLLGTGIDATELRGIEERLRYVSNFDTLTGLPNRMLLRERLRAMKTQARTDGRLVGFLLLRFARIPLIREALGPGAEQAVLQQVAGRLKDLAGQDAVGCFSEGAFAIAALRGNADELAQTARRLLTALTAPYAHEQEELHLDPAIGIAVYPNDGLSYETLAKGAEAALRLAADGGGQRYAFYRPELNRGANDRFRLENALRRAIDRNELELHYQPQVRPDGTLVGAEALLRWRHPERGLVGPGSFIPLAEECGLILSIGEWVLRAACLQLRDWQRAGVPMVPVSVNLSAHQFTDQIVGTVRHILDECGVDPALVELELTESASMADASKTCELLAQLKAMGIRLAIDDFGTGYSNLNYLKRFPVDKLKLDQSFVRDILADPDDLAISSAVIAMAHGLELTVVAEGVETEGQLAALEELDCDMIQGFHISHAVPATDFAKMMEAGRAGPATAAEPRSPPPRS